MSAAATNLVIVSLLSIYLILSLLKTALRSLSLVAIRRLTASHEGRGRRHLEAYLENPSEFVTHLQTVIQACLVAACVLMTNAAMRSPLQWSIWAVLAATVGGVVVVEQFFARFVWSVDRERWLMRLLPAYVVLEPIVLRLWYPLSRFYRLLFRRKAGEGTDGEVSDEDVRAYIAVGERAGILDEGDGEMIESVVDFGDTVVREVMTPRVDMAGVEAGRSVVQARDQIIRSKHSRMPVFRERVDNIEGVVDIMDLIKAWREGKGGEKVVAWMKPTRFVPETKKVSGLLREFQRDRVTFAVVVDEYGGISGLVTIEDLVEEIVGEIAEEYEDTPEQIVRQSDGSYLVSAKVDIEQLDDVFDLEIEHGNYDTVGGLVFATLGRIPSVGEEFALDGLRIQVVEADQRRVNKVRVIPDGVGRSDGAAADGADR